MANVGEWLKGISFFLFTSLLFYFFWENIFSTIITFVGTDIFNIGTEAATSISILKTAIWISFILLYLGTSGGYLLYSILIGSTGSHSTSPLQFLYGIAAWVILMPVAVFLYGLSHFIISPLNSANILTGESASLALQFSWIFSVIILLALFVVPFSFILKGYGVDLFSKVGLKG